MKYPLLDVKVKVLSTGFEVFRKLSNTALLETFHHPLGRVVHSCARSASVRFKVATTSLMENRWNVKRLVEAGTIPKIGHCEPWLRDTLLDIIAGTALARLDIPMIRRWKRIDTSIPPCIPRDVIWAGSETSFAALTPPRQDANRIEVRHPRHSNKKTWEWLSEMTHCLPWVCWLRTPDVIAKAVDALVSDGSLNTESLYSASGIRASTADIERLAERVTGGMAARQALRLVEFGQLRARVLAPVTTITVEAAARIRP